MEFRIETVYTKQDFRGLLHAVKARRNRGKPGRRAAGTLLHIAAWAVMAFYWLSVALLFAARRTRSAWSMVGTGIPLLVIFALALVLRSERVLAALSWRNYKEKGQTVSYRFCEDCFMVYTPVSDQRFYYAVMEAVLEDRDAYFLFTGPSTAHILRKTAFTEGGAENFRGFIERVTGKPVELVR